MTRTPLVVLVEDSPTQARAITMCLNEYGIDVVVAADGPVGIQVVYEEQPDVVVLDVNLPTMNGYQVARRLKRDPATAAIPVIMLTKLGDTKSLVEGLNHGADCYITKGPDTAQELWRTLKGFGVIAWH